MRPSGATVAAGGAASTAAGTAMSAAAFTSSGGASSPGVFEFIANLGRGALVALYELTWGELTFLLGGAVVGLALCRAADVIGQRRVNAGEDGVASDKITVRLASGGAADVAVESSTSSGGVDGSRGGAQRGFGRGTESVPGSGAEGASASTAPARTVFDTSERGDYGQPEARTPLDAAGSFAAALTPPPDATSSLNGDKALAAAAAEDGGASDESEQSTTSTKKLLESIKSIRHSGNGGGENRAKAAAGDGKAGASLLPATGAGPKAADGDAAPRQGIFRSLGRRLKKVIGRPAVEEQALPEQESASDTVAEGNDAPSEEQQPSSQTATRTKVPLFDSSLLEEAAGPAPFGEAARADTKWKLPESWRREEAPKEAPKEAQERRARGRAESPGIAIAAVVMTIAVPLVYAVVDLVSSLSNGSEADPTSDEEALLGGDVDTGSSSDD